MHHLRVHASRKSKSCFPSQPEYSNNTTEANVDGCKLEQNLDDIRNTFNLDFFFFVLLCLGVNINIFRLVLLSGWWKHHSKGGIHRAVQLLHFQALSKKEWRSTVRILFKRIYHYVWKLGTKYIYYFHKCFFFLIKITEHDLLNISIIHWLTHISNSTVGYLQTKQFLNILLKN